MVSAPEEKENYKTVGLKKQTSFIKVKQVYYSTLVLVVRPDFH